VLEKWKEETLNENDAKKEKLAFLSWGYNVKQALLLIHGAQGEVTL